MNVAGGLERVMDDNLSYLDRVDDDCANSNAATEDGSPTSSGVELCEVRLYSWQITKKNCILI